MPGARHRHGAHRSAPVPPLRRGAADIDWQQYKALCERPDVMSRWMLNETAALVPATLAAPLRATMTATPLAKPADHKGGAATDMFELCPQAPVADILAAVEAAAGRGATTSGGGALRGLKAAWRELDEWRRSSV